MKMQVLMLLMLNILQYNTWYLLEDIYVFLHNEKRYFLIDSRNAIVQQNKI